MKPKKKFGGAVYKKILTIISPVEVVTDEED